ncbi:uncharacterized protein LOC122238134 isoform X2 [Panthera tigris]|uniref:uncharacterized protein LOC122238134 isoform X2 n=1 Tax=Panthera tigris TaxID=9694 RepID=UPI001C6F64C3|nr:uncharacterized protein LOC122238134 isoform X2 [Panthera tigris]XP_042840946.1 uncharacterized protein LOC122238134 isoform X2 [Panthera tigris]
MLLLPSPRRHPRQSLGTWRLAFRLWPPIAESRGNRCSGTASPPWAQETGWSVQRGASTLPSQGQPPPAISPNSSHVALGKPFTLSSLSFLLCKTRKGRPMPGLEESTYRCWEGAISPLVAARVNWSNHTSISEWMGVRPAGPGRVPVLTGLLVWRKSLGDHPARLQHSSVLTVLCPLEQHIHRHWATRRRPAWPDTEPCLPKSSQEPTDVVIDGHPHFTGRCGDEGSRHT